MTLMSSCWVSLNLVVPGSKINNLLFYSSTYRKIKPLKVIQGKGTNFEYIDLQSLMYSEEW